MGGQGSPLNPDKGTDVSACDIVDMTVIVFTRHGELAVEREEGLDAD